MKVALIVFGDAPPGLARSVLEGLESPWEGAYIKESDEDVSGWVDRRRLQADALQVLEFVPKKEDSCFWLGLLGVDLMLAPLAYVCGVAPVGSGRGLVSWARLGEGVGVQSTHFLDRVIKEAMHELGHAAGLVHCVVHDCVMHASIRPDHMDLKKKGYCPSCRETLLEKLGG